MIIFVPVDELRHFKLSVRQWRRVGRRDDARNAVGDVDANDLREMSGWTVANCKSNDKS
jgi:hypothetical protein